MPTLVDSPWGPMDIDTGEGASSSVSDRISIFDPAIRATGGPDGNPLIILGIRTAQPQLLIVDANGKLLWEELDRVVLDWRFNFTDETWIDTHGNQLEGTE